MVDEEQREQRLTAFKNNIKDMIANSREAYTKTEGREVRNRFRVDYSKKDIHEIVTNGTAIERARLSRYFFSISGLYKRIITHYATILSYYWVCSPHLKRRQDSLEDKKIQNSCFAATSFLSNFGVSKQCALFAKEVLTQGGYYGIIHDDGDKMVIQDLPFSYCRSRYKDHHDNDIVEFNVSFFDTISDEQLKSQILKTYPTVVQQGYQSYKKGKGQWIFLPANIGVYFQLFEEKPFFLDLIPLIDDLEDYRQIDKQRNVLSLKRILTQKVPHDGMNLVFEPDEAAEMHKGVLDMLEANPDVDVITSYNDINLLQLRNTNTDSDTTLVQDAQQLIYDAAGVSKELFSATTDTGIDYSLKNDISLMKILADSFAHFFEEQVNRKFGTSKISFKVSILPTGLYNQAEYTDTMKDLATFGYCWTLPSISTGIDQVQLLDLKLYEQQALELQNLFMPLSSSYTQTTVEQEQPAAEQEQPAAEQEQPAAEQEKEVT